VILRLLDATRGRATQADAVSKHDETLVLRLVDGNVVAAESHETWGRSLRVNVAGRIGTAGTTDGGDGLVAAAFESASVGDDVPILLPSPSPLPSVTTHVPRAAAASIAELTRLGRRVHERLRRDGREVSVRIERSVGSVHVANTRGVDIRYPVSLVTLQARVRAAQADTPVSVMARTSAADLPDHVELDQLVADLERRLGWAARIAEPPAAAGRGVVLLPDAFRVLLSPVLLAFVGRSAEAGVSPLADARGERLFAPSLTLTDDPLRPGKPGSRPVDDEGVPSYAAPLIQDGVVCRFVHTLESGARAGRPSTGHGRWSTFGKPQAALSNVVIAGGTESVASLLGSMGDGLLIDTVSSGGSARSGSFTHPVLLGYRVAKGEVTGRVEGVAVSGNMVEALGRIGGIGNEIRWVGSAGLPPVLLDGLSVGAR
jgi:PmbA protein